MRETSIKKNQLCDSLGGGCSVVHCNTDVSTLKRQRIVDAIAGHCDDFTLFLQCLHDCAFLLWRNTTKDISSCQRCRNFLNGCAHGARIDWFMTFEADHSRNCADCMWIVTRNHNDAHALCAEIRQSFSGVVAHFFAKENDCNRREIRRQICRWCCDGGVCNEHDSTTCVCMRGYLCEK